MTPFLKLSISFSMKCFDIHTHHVPLSPEYVIRSIAVGRDVMDAHAVHLSVGIHPWFLTEDNVDQLLFTLRQSLGDERVVALGEAGLDKLRGEAMTIQTTVFRQEEGVSLCLQYLCPYPYGTGLLLQVFRHSQPSFCGYSKGAYRIYQDLLLSPLQEFRQFLKSAHTYSLFREVFLLFRQRPLHYHKSLLL